MKDTSKQAYEEIKPHLSLQQYRVLNALKLITWYDSGKDGYLFHIFTNNLPKIKKGASTSQRLSELSKHMAIQLDYEMVRKRMGELEKLGLVRDSGKRAKTSSGRNAIIWEVI